MTTAKRATRNDVARRANVSGWTVSQVLNARSEFPISEDARARVLAAAQELAYRPNHMARALVTGNMGLVSLWIGRMAPYYWLVAKCLQRQISRHGLPMLITEMDGRTEEVSQLSWSVDGIIVVDYPEYFRAFLEAHPRLTVPFISIGDYYLEDHDYVGVDLRSGAREAMEHLFSIGCRRVIFVQERKQENEPEQVWEARFDVYTAHMRQAGLTPEYLSVPTRAAARQSIQTWIARNGVPDAIFCHNNDLALGVYRGLCDLGICVPGEVALVGCDGIEDTEYLERPLTTIVQPVERMCALAWEYLSRRITDPTIPARQIVLRPELAIRASTRCERTAGGSNVF